MGMVILTQQMARITQPITDHVTLMFGYGEQQIISKTIIRIEVLPVQSLQKVWHPAVKYFRNSY